MTIRATNLNSRILKRRRNCGGARGGEQIGGDQRRAKRRNRAGVARGDY